MPSVWADNEEVVFDGEFPDEPAQVYDLLMNALSEQRRVIVGFVVDGVDALREGGFPEKYEKIEIDSKTHDEVTLQLIQQTMTHLGDAGEQFAAYAANVLKTPWSEVFQRMDELITKIKPFAELLDNLNPYATTYSPPWQEKFLKLSSDQAGSLSNLLAAFEKGSPSHLSEELGVTFSSVYGRAQKLFNEEIIPFLENQIQLESQAG